MNYSTTQGGNLAAVVGLIVLVLNHFHVNVGSDELMLVIGATITIVGTVASWVSRYRKGDLTVSGFRRPVQQ